ncbi:MAG: anthranilate phosphoribosyltransferase [Acidobacteriota bacterium]
MLRSAIGRVVAGEDLSREEARLAVESIMRGEATPSQIAGLLVALRMKGETVDEIVGSAEAMRAAALRLHVAVDNLVDTCGTGGDGAGTFNISTTAAFVVAGAGVPVAKHGNRAISSACGSADVLEALGVTLLSEPERLASCLAQAGIAFLFAPFQHPAMKHAVGPRRELAIRTIFNLLGPLTNPAGARRQLVGVYDGGLVSTLAEVLGRLGSERALVVHGAGGLDELSTLGPSQVAEWDGEGVRAYQIDPQQLGLPASEADQLRGGSKEENAATIRAVLEGREGPARDIVVLNAAAAIYAGGGVDSIETGLDVARESIDSGAAANCLAALVRHTAAEESR